MGETYSEAVTNFTRGGGNGMKDWGFTDIRGNTFNITIEQADGFMGYMVTIDHTKDDREWGMTLNLSGAQLGTLRKLISDAIRVEEV